MKFIVLAFALLLAGISALPQDNDAIGGQERIITGRLERLFEQVRLYLAQFDPLRVHKEKEIQTPVGGAKLWIKDFECSGYSDIQIVRLRWAPATSRLYMTLEMPRVVCKTKSTGYYVSVLGRESSATLSGGVEVVGLRLEGELRFLVTSLRNCDMKVSADVQAYGTLETRHGTQALGSGAEAFNRWLKQNEAVIGERICDAIRKAM